MGEYKMKEVSERITLAHQRISSWEEVLCKQFIIRGKINNCKRKISLKTVSSVHDLFVDQQKRSMSSTCQSDMTDRSCRSRKIRITE